MNLRFFLKCLALTVPVLLAGCKSSSSVQRSDASALTPAFDLAAYKNKVVSQAPKMKALTAKISLSLQAGSKNIAASGSLKMKKDEVIQLSITFLGMEVGRMEFTPKDVLLVDRFNKQYVRAPYGNVDFLRNARLDFNALQALFWNELFVPGESQLSDQVLKRFAVNEQDDYVVFDLTDAPQLVYSFQTVKGNGLLDCTTIRGKDASDPMTFTWRYGDFTEAEGQTFPGRMSLAVGGLKKGSYTLDIALSKFTTASDWETTTQISSKYKQRSVNDIMRQLMAL